MTRLQRSALGPFLLSHEHLAGDTQLYSEEIIRSVDFLGHLKRFREVTPPTLSIMRVSELPLHHECSNTKRPCRGVLQEATENTFGANHVTLSDRMSVFCSINAPVISASLLRPIRGMRARRDPLLPSSCNHLRRARYPPRHRNVGSCPHSASPDTHDLVQHLTSVDIFTPRTHQI